MIEILTTGNKVAIVDDEDSDLIKLKWQAVKRPRSKTHYAQTGITKPRHTTIAMHRIILSRVLERSLLRHEQVDHINGNGLDNRRCNLRLANQSNNASNVAIKSNNTSGYKGVSRYSHSKWRAQIVVNQKYIHLGIFDTAEEAHKAYCEAAKLHFGNFAKFE